MYMSPRHLVGGLVLASVFALGPCRPFVAYAQASPKGEVGQKDVNSSKPTAVVQQNPIQFRVDCGNANGKLKPIGTALQLLGNLHPVVLLISGTCHENVVIQGLTDITLQGNPTATIDGGVDGNVGAVEISGSMNIALNSLTVTGGGEGVGCFDGSVCFLTQVTVQGSLGDGVGVGGGAHLKLVDCTIRNNADVGLSIAVGSAAFFGGQIAGNASDGVLMRAGGAFGTAPGNLTPNVTIQNNSGNGIRTAANNTVTLASAVISGNAANGVALQIGSAINLNSSAITDNAIDGVTLQSGSAMSMFAGTVTNNGGHQIRIGDLSIVRFAGFASNIVNGPNYPDVVCDPRFSTTRQLAANAVGATTNCPAELPPTP